MNFFTRNSLISSVGSFGIERKRFFYDYFSSDDVCGIFNLPHLITVILFFGIAFILLYFSRKMSEKAVCKTHLTVAIAITLMEIVKISIRIYKGQGYDDWVPLYYCSLFIFAVWISLSKNQLLKTVGNSYIVMGGISASIFFTFYPSTSLAIFPIWHPSVAHSFVYHLTMLYLGCLFIMKNVYRPKPLHALHYFTFILLASVPSLILNHFLGTNCMFLRHAFGLPILGDLERSLPAVYALIVFSAQAIALFWANYLVHFTVRKIINNKRKNADKQAYGVDLNKNKGENL